MRRSAFRVWVAFIGISMMLGAGSAAGVDTSVEAPDPAQSEQAALSRAEQGASGTAGVQPARAGMEAVAENGHLILYLDAETTEIAVEHKRLGSVWHSNPPDREQDATATGYNKTILGSQLLLAYSDFSGKPQQYDNVNQSVANGQYEIEKLGDGVRITYTIGEKTRGIEQIPKYIGEERFQTLILDKIEDAARRGDLEKRFRYDEERKVYERRDAALVGIGLSRTLDTFAAVGYDEAERNIDRQAYTDGEIVNQAQFVVSLTYRLEEDELVASVSTEGLQMNGYYVHSLAVLPFFGAAGADKEGYMFVPDGSGSLIYLNNGKHAAASFKTALYGTDSARIFASKPANGSEARLPVFGLKRDDEAFVAIIEQGDAVGMIEADISGRTNGYNTVYSSYAISASEQFTLSGNWNSKTFPRFQREPYRGDIAIRYAFLKGDDASYAGMAARYRDYLFGDRARLAQEEHTPFYLELIGGIPKRKFFLGIPYESYEPLTTFGEARHIVREMKGAGISNIQLRYVGWFNGGVSHALADTVSADRKLGGRSGLEELLDYAANNDIEVYPDAALMHVYDNKGFRPRKQGVRDMLGHVAKVYSYNAVTYMRDRSKPFSYLLSPAGLPGLVDDFLTAYAKLPAANLSVRDMGGELYSDFNEKRLITREETKGIVAGELRRLGDSLNGLMIEGGNGFAVPYADSVINAPLTSSRFNIADAEVPFYQMALHGYVDYAGEAANMADEQAARYHVLKALETGASLHYTWFYAKPSAVKETDYDYLHAANYRDWLPEAALAYREVDETLRRVRTELIVNHEILADGVFATTYERGTRVVVNYNPHSVAVDGETIEAMGYRVGGERN